MPHEGNATEFKVDARLWCCKKTKDNCIVESIGNRKVVTCIGQTLRLSQQCHGFESNSLVCNYYPFDENRNVDYSMDGVRPIGGIRSYLNICNDERYVQQGPLMRIQKEVLRKPLKSPPHL